MKIQTTNHEGETVEATTTKNTMKIKGWEEKFTFTRVSHEYDPTFIMASVSLHMNGQHIATASSEVTAKDNFWYAEEMGLGRSGITAEEVLLKMVTALV